MSARDSLELSIVGRWASLTLEGEYDLANAERIPNAARDLLGRGITEMTFDLCRVLFLDVSAINALRSANELLARRGGRLVLVGLSALVERVLRLTGLDRGLPALAQPGGGRSPGRGDSEATIPCNDLADDLATLAASLLVADTITGDLRRVVRLVAETLPGTSAASFTLIARGAPRTAAPSDPVAVEIDIAQYDHGGPCVRAARTGERGSLRPVGDDAAVVSATGVADVCSVPVTLAGETIGSLNCYTTDASFDDEVEATAEILAGMAAAAVARSYEAAAARRLAPTSPPALAAPDEVGDPIAAASKTSVAAYCHLTRSGAPELGRLAATARQLACRVTS